MTPADLQRLRSLALKATPGHRVQGMVSGRCHVKHAHGLGQCSYEYTIATDDDYARRFVSIEPNVTLIGSDDNGPILGEADAAFIAALSPDVVIALLDQLEVLRAMTPGWSSGERDRTMLEIARLQADRDRLAAEVAALRRAAMPMLASIAFVNDETDAGELRMAVAAYLKDDRKALELWLDALHAIQALQATAAKGDGNG